MDHSACGLDFGTSNSTVGWYRPPHQTLLPLEDGKTTLPSVVFFNTEDHITRFGRAALADYLSGSEGRLMRSLKSLLGSSLMDDETSVQGRALSFRALLGRFIGELKQRAEQAAGRPFTQAVLGRPVFFVDGNPAADRLAQDTLEDVAREAGFSDIAFQYEPIAAAFDYELSLEREHIVLVADIGGGTSDFSVVRLSPQRAQKSDRRDDILANGGVHIGGTDFDKYLSLSSVMPMLGLGSQLVNGAEMPSGVYFDLATWHTINETYTRRAWHFLKDVHREARDKTALDRLLYLIRHRAGHRLALKVEEGKIALSQERRSLMTLERIVPGESVVLTRDGFEQAIGGMVRSIEQTVEEVLRQAGIARSAVDTVFFTGGSSGVPYLRERIAALVPQAQRAEADPFGAIGAGLALDAARKFGMRPHIGRVGETHA